jgi:hypothetical protein
MYIPIRRMKAKPGELDEGMRRAEWVKENLAPLAAGPHEIVAVGEMRFRKGK